ncbi:hypothetical protein BCR44DRAFT_1423433 [Catenaria anguillulae PL171]|uniref:Uncharacterized protein n=1 Tax=Catenaria anguillulae PL171 TaxID=765915 RepID=A0A1Y2I4M6_9FUNG|nr:hypothetical protein BCR44DRAFT_1423433 [Catenaria anguillulae PL171]
MRPIFLLIILAVLASMAIGARPPTKKPTPRPIPPPRNNAPIPPARPAPPTRSHGPDSCSQPIFAPNTLVKASYAADMPPELAKPANPAVILAQCQFTTNRPTLNLANIVQIRSIKCEKNAMAITFDSPASAGSAHQTWSKHRDFAVIIPRKWRCEGINEVSFRVVTSAMVSANRRHVILLKTGSIRREDLLTEYDIALTKIATPGGVDASTLAKRAKAQKFPVAVTPQVVVHCVDCNVRGRAQLSLRVKGNKLGVKSYDVDLSGELAGDLGVNVRTYNPFSKTLAEVPLFVLPLSPVSVPGILSVGPELRLTTSVTLSVEGKVRVVSGATVNTAFHWQVSSTKGLASKPTKIVSAQPSIKMHPLTIQGQAMTSVEGHLSPSFNLALSVFKWSAFDMSFGWDSAVGLGVSINGTATVNKQGFKLGAKGELTADAYHRHSVALGIKTAGLGEWNFPLWETERHVIPGTALNLAKWDKTINDDDKNGNGGVVQPGQPGAIVPAGAALTA